MMKRTLTALMLAALLAAGGTARADDLVIPGLGTLSFSKDVHVTSGEGTAVEAAIRRNLARPEEQRSKRTSLMRFFAMPVGAVLANGTDDCPAGRVRIYQLIKQDHTLMHIMSAFEFSGTGEELFPRDKKLRAWWEEAFRTGKKPGKAQEMTLISVDDFERAAREVMNRGEGDPVQFDVLDASPWRAYHNEDGTLRWQQRVKFVVTAKNGLLAAVWFESVLFRNEDGQYHFLIFSGSHESGRQFSDEILYALYRIRREKA